jgi:hypothetical protein
MRGKLWGPMCDLKRYKNSVLGKRSESCSLQTGVQCLCNYATLPSADQCLWILYKQKLTFMLLLERGLSDARKWTSGTGTKCDFHAWNTGVRCSASRTVVCVPRRRQRGKVYEFWAFNDRCWFSRCEKQLSAISNFRNCTYLLMYGAEPFLRSYQLCSHSGNCHQF